MDISAVLVSGVSLWGVGSLGLSHGEDIPLGDSQKAKEPNRIRKGAGS